MLTFAIINDMPFMLLSLAMKNMIRGIQNCEACSRRFPIPTLLSRYFNTARNKRFIEMIIFDHARPGHFTEMVMLSLGIDQESLANSILVIAGILDFISAALIFCKGTPRNIGLLYMFIWGSLTAMARPWSRFDSYDIVGNLNIWIPEMLYRAPHFMIPVCLLLALKMKSEHVKLPLKKNHT